VSGGKGYSYTTISAQPGQTAQIRVSFYLDEQAWITVPGTGTAAPHLQLSHGAVSVTVSPAAEAVTAQDAQIACALADAAARYAAEIQRLYSAGQETQAGNSGQPGGWRDGLMCGGAAGSLDPPGRPWSLPSTARRRKR
jgi:hypothetical protein